MPSLLPNLKDFFVFFLAKQSSCEDVGSLQHLQHRRWQFGISQSAVPFSVLPVQVLRASRSTCRCCPPGQWHFSMPSVSSSFCDLYKDVQSWNENEETDPHRCGEQMGPSTGGYMPAVWGAGDLTFGRRKLNKRVISRMTMRKARKRTLKTGRMKRTVLTTLYWHL